MQRGTLVLTGISALFAFLGAVVSVGIFTIDEAVYVFGADIFRTTGGFVFDNGYARFGSADLAWTHFLPPGPHGQSTQYPPGMSVLGGAMMMLFDARGLIFLNIAATIGTLFVTRALGREMFGQAALGLGACLILVGASFVAEYAVAYWPHMISVFAVSLSFLLFWRALTGTGSVVIHAMLSGLVLGLGMQFRLDCILLLPVIGLVTLLYARDWPQMAGIGMGGAAGLAPPILALSMINMTRYGTPNPLSYGAVADGGTSLGVYLPLIAGGIVLGAGLVAIRAIGPSIRPRIWIGLAGLGGLAGLALVPELRAFGAAYAWGVLRLVVDATWIVDSRSSVVPGPDGTLLFWGLAKKALGQSLPWLGILLALLGLVWQAETRVRQSITVLLLFVALWTFPFLVRSWHGGLGANMRYFMPALPALALLAAWTIARLMADDRQAVRLLLIGGMGGFLAAGLWTRFSEAGLIGAHQILSTWLFLAVAAGGLLAGLLASRPIHRIALCLAGIGLGSASFYGIIDAGAAQIRRANFAGVMDLSHRFEGEVLFYRHNFRSATVTPAQYAAYTSDGLPDPDLVDDALAAGLRVVLPEELARDFIAEDPRYAISGPPRDPYAMVDLVPLTPE